MTTRDTCADQALATAERLLDPAAVLAACPAGGTLHGLAGTALLHARLATAHSRFAEIALQHWQAAATHATWRAPNHGAGIFAEPGGLAASLIIGSGYLPDPARTREATRHAARWLSAHALHTAGQRHTSNHGAPVTPWHVYDTLTGLTGTGRVLLAATQHGHTEAEPGLTATLTTLTALLAPRRGTCPGWWLPADQHPDGVSVDPSGAATTGLAHGVAGPLALLSIAQLAGHSVPRQTDAIRYAAISLLHWRSADGTWPPYVSGDELDTHTAPHRPGRRDGWCYGNPGISRALTLAGQALNDPTLTATGQEAIASLADRGPDQWDVEGPTLCHGHAGILQTAPAGSATAELAATASTAAFDPHHPFGFQHHERSTSSDVPGFLTGAAGVALALADHSHLPTPEHATRWDALLLLS